MTAARTLGAGLRVLATGAALLGMAAPIAAGPVLPECPSGEESAGIPVELPGPQGWAREAVARAWGVEPDCLRLDWPLGPPESAIGTAVALEGSGAAGRWTLVVDDSGRRKRIPLRASTWALVPVAVRSLSRGTVVSEGDAELRAVLVEGPPPPPASLPLGWVTARALAPGSVLESPGVHPPLAVRVGEEVEVHRTGPGVRAWARGVVLRSGAAGDTVEVRVAGGARRRVEVRGEGRVELIRPARPGGAIR